MKINLFFSQTVTVSKFNRDGNWFNDSVCSEGEYEDKVGSVEPSEEEENRKKH